MIIKEWGIKKRLYIQYNRFHQILLYCYKGIMPNISTSLLFRYKFSV